jgi:hypothetical protein
MADGTSPTLPPKEAIALGMKYFRELMEGQPTPRILLEGLDLDEDHGNWIVTFGFDSEREKPHALSPLAEIREAMNPGGVLFGKPVVEILREFRSIHLSTSDGKFVKLDHA